MPLRIAELLIAKGADMNARNRDGYTPLHFAAWNGHKGVVKALVGAGANRKEKSNQGISAVQLAARNGYRDVALELVDWSDPLEQGLIATYYPDPTDWSPQQSYLNERTLRTDHMRTFQTFDPIRGHFRLPMQLRPNYSWERLQSPRLPPSEFPRRP